MSSSAHFYHRLYKNELDEEAAWLEISADGKFQSVSFLTENLPRPFASMFDLGSGTGAILRRSISASLARKYYGVDSSADALAFSACHLSDSVTLIEHDLELGAPNLDHAGLALLSHVLEHLEDPHRVLRDLSTRCDFLLAEVPLENQIVPRSLAFLRYRSLAERRRRHNAGHVRFFTATSFEALLMRAGWKIVRRYRYSPYVKKIMVHRLRQLGRNVNIGLLMYYFSRFLGRRLSTHLLTAHYAVLAAPAKKNSR